MPDCEAEARILRAVFALEVMAGTWVIDLGKIKGILTGADECHGHKEGALSGKTMADVLAEHQWYDATSDNEDPATGCIGCDDWFGSEDALDDGTFAAHQAAALAAAGYGFMADAWDRGMGDQLNLLNAGPGYEMGNPYGRRP